MIRSSKLTLKFTNKNKKDNLVKFIDEYKQITQSFINLLWEEEKLTKFISKQFTNQITTWLSKRAVQCAAKQASSIVRGTRKKQEQRLFIYNKLVEAGWTRKAKKLKKVIDKSKISKPIIKSIQPELDSRFVKLDTNNQTSFDIWITLTSLGNKLKIQLPINKSKHFNSLKGKLNQGIRISNNEITFTFESELNQREVGNTIGLDIGILTTCTLSDGQTTQDKDSWNLQKIQEKLAIKKKGSNAFRKAQTHRSNYIGWSINQLNLNNVKTLKLEKIKDIRKNTRTSRLMSHWTYTEIFEKLERICEELGVQVEQVNPTYTSQRCSECGWVRKSNRKGKIFKCGKCQFELDADLNGAKNIALPLQPIRTKERQLRKNRLGFYWNELDRSL